MLCPRCGSMCSAAASSELVSSEESQRVRLIDITVITQVIRCPQCRQVLPPYLPVVDKVFWQLNEGDTGYYTPFTYNRALINVPGIAQPVTMNRRINQSVCDFIRKHFIPRHSDVWLVTYPKSGTSK